MLVSILTHALLIVVCLVAVYSRQAEAADALDIADRREPFVDDVLIEHLKGVRLMMHEPIDRGPVMSFDKPWEGAFSGYVTIIKDGGLFRLYYRGLPAVDGVERTCYAESRDGIRWAKPELGLHEVDGSSANNVILANGKPVKSQAKHGVSHNFSPMLDSRPSAGPQHRFKALASGDHGHTLIALSSPDGIHWSQMSNAPAITYTDPGPPDLASREIGTHRFAFDSQNVAFWSESEQKYVAYTRVNLLAPLEPGSTAKKRTVWRSIARAESNDFVEWSELRWMDYSDTGTPLTSHQIYTNQTHPYFRAPHIYLSIAARFMPNRQVLTEQEAAAVGVDPQYFKDTSDAVLMSSRGGYDFDRTFSGAFIRPGIGAANWVSRSNYPVLNIVQTGEHEMSVYTNRNYAQPTSYLNRYSLRLDGIGSIRGGSGGGEAVTRPLRFSGDRLILNFSTSAAGGIRVAIQEADGRAIPGYTLDDCRLLIGDDIERVVDWRGGTSVTRLAGREVRLCLEIRDADLYALKFDRNDATAH